MPTPRNFSLKTFPALKESPFKDWLALATNEREFDSLIRTFQGIPKLWVEWAEKQVSARTKRGVKIDKPLIYRLSVLWHGIILLQEGKFICDFIENAFRQSFIQHTAINSITYSDIRFSGWDVIQTRLKDKRISIGPKSAPSLDFLCCLSFQQLTGTMYINWSYAYNSEKEGFRDLFFSSFRCRDRSLFQSDSKKIGDYRNKIAHSETLFTPEEIQDLYDRACTWLEPLDVEMKQRVFTYRDKRPRFLEDLKIP